MNRRYFRRRTKRTGVVIVCVVVLAAVRLSQDLATPPAPQSLDSGEFLVERIVDGDTLKLQSGARLRLQGIDAPEAASPDRAAEPWGPEATEYTRAFLEQADHLVRVEFGPERKDRYGRFLGFVFHQDRLLNEELVRDGLALATTNYHFSDAMKRRLQQAEDEARAAGRGIWSR